MNYHMGMDQLASDIQKIVKDLHGQVVEVELTRPEEQFGDYACNVAMRLAPSVGKSPREVAEGLTGAIGAVEGVESAEVAGPGFINIKMTDDYFNSVVGSILEKKDKFGKSLGMKDQSVVVEYSDPNPFKVLHVGHLYTSVVGDAIANLFENAGASVHRVNFGGDVGRHVAITIWSILQEFGGEKPDNLQKIDKNERAKWLAGHYVAGTNKFENDESVKSQVQELNVRIYEIVASKDVGSPLGQIYWVCRGWSYDYFDEFYARIGSSFEKYYPESETVEGGLAAVKENIGRVFTESEGAVVFNGEIHNMHTRVFINNQGLPTYETKDIGLILKKQQDFSFERSIVITGNEQAEYMQVVLKALEQFQPDLAAKTTHITHGLVKMPGGVKMSSRLGNILGAEDVIDVVDAANTQANGKQNMVVTLGALRYGFTRYRIGADIHFDPNESVSLHGNSGPYLQYAFARANSILEKAESGKRKAESADQVASSELRSPSYDAAERSLARKISEYPEIVAKATAELMPHHICTYLYQLAQQFNSFYETSRIIGDERQTVRLRLAASYAQVLKNGLRLVGVETIDHI